MSGTDCKERCVGVWQQAYCLLQLTRMVAVVCHRLPPRQPLDKPLGGVFIWIGEEEENSRLQLAVEGVKRNLFF